MVPNGWSATQFGELADFKSGGTPSKQNANYWGGDEPWISGKDLKSHYLSTSIDRLTIEGFSIAKKTPLGSTLILVRGMTLLKDFPVGYTTKEVAFNQDIKALLAKSNIDGLFLSFLLVGNKHKIKNLVTTAGHGTGRLDTESLKAFPVDLPPLPEQRKIAKILSTWDRGIATTEKLIDASKQQKKALMQQLLTGKKRLVDPETGKAFEGDWEEVRLDDLATYRRGSFPQPYGNPEWVDEINGYPFIQVYDIAKNMRLKQQTKTKISDAAIGKSVFIKLGTVIVSLQGSIGRVAITQYDAYVDRTVLLFQQFKRPMNTVYFAYAIQELFNIEKEKAPGGTIKTITKQVLSNFTIAVPMFKEQQKIASVLTAADKEIELLEAKLAHFKQEKKALMQQLLTGKRRVSLSS